MNKLTKSIAVALALMPAVGYGMKPISEIANLEATPDRMAYIAARCGAMYSAIATLQMPAEIKAVVEDGFNISSSYSVAIMMDRGRTEEKAYEMVVNTMTKIEPEYIAMMNDSYINTSEYLNHPVMADDMDACGRMYKELKKRVSGKEVM